MNTFTFNGTSADSLGLIVSGKNQYDSAEREYDEWKVPGRPGKLVKATGSFKNVEVKYEVAIKKVSDMAAAAQTLRNWLLAPLGYCVLTDTYCPNDVRLAKFKGSFSETIGYLCETGKATIVFDCQPQRYTTSGYNVWITPGNRISDAYPLVNNTQNVAKPIYRVEFGGSDDTTITIQKSSIASEVYGTLSFDESVANGAGHSIVFYDSEIEHAYYEDGSNANAAVTITGDVTLPPNTTRYVWQDSQNAVNVHRREWNL